MREIALSAVHNLDGLIAWSRRDEWREPFGMLLDLHTGRACADAGISLAELGALLGDDVMSAIFGAVFEDLLALDVPYGRNVADEYLRRHGWKESAATRAYIAALRSRRACRNVKRWRDAAMAPCLKGAAMLEDSIGFRRHRAYR